MATKTFAPPSVSNIDWDNAANWVGGLPLPGDTAVIGPQNESVVLGNLTLDDIKVDLVDGNLWGRESDLTLIDSQVEMGGKNFGGVNWNNSINTQTLELDRMSFIIDNNVGFSGLYVSQGITNDGTICVEASGAVLQVVNELGSSGQLVATNGGALELFTSNVTGAGGQVKVTNGGSLILSQSTIGATEQVSFGGQDKTTLALDPSSSVAAPLSGFLPTDTIDLLDFQATNIALAGTVNPAIIAINAFYPITGGVPEEVIKLSGNYAHYAFTLSRDAAGTGTDITVHPAT
jgi:hypothetical protein